MTETIESAEDEPHDDFEEDFIEEQEEVKESFSLRPSVAGTCLIISGAFITPSLLTSDIPSRNAFTAAVVMLIAIGASALADWKRGLRNLLRVDLIALLALYFLTFFEFLFPQPSFDTVNLVQNTNKGITLIVIAMVGLAIGRHFFGNAQSSFRFLQNVEPTPRLYFICYLGIFFISSFFMFNAVKFNPIAVFEALIAPRFHQPWGRGQYGNWATLLNELSLLGYVVPPLAAVIFGQREKYTRAQLAVVFILLVVQMFFAFAAGTRNVLAIYMASALGAYFIIQKEVRIKQVLLSGAATAVAFFYASEHMLHFRNIGLKSYVQHGYYKDDVQSSSMDQYAYFVDYNLQTIAALVDVFPEQYEYVGWNFPYVAATKPIPRALWKGKPKDLEMGIEQALGARGMTLAATFVGESYMAGGEIAVFGTGLFLGLLFAWWNRLGGKSNTVFSMLVYSVGFFCALISMRSLMFLTTAMLPSVALLVYAKFFLKPKYS